MAILDPQELRQGTIVRGGRWFAQYGDLYSLTKEEGGIKVVPAVQLRDRQQSSVVKSVEADLAVLTQSCDIRKRGELILAPVFPLLNSELPLDENDISQMRNHRLTWAFYLGERALAGCGFPESYVDLRNVCCIQKSVVERYTVVRVLDQTEADNFRKFLFNCFGRPGIEDDIVDAVKPVFTAARKRGVRTNIHSFWVNQHSRPIGLIAVFHESDPAMTQKLEKAAERANRENSSQMCVVLQCKLKEHTTFTDVEGYVRMGWENLSFRDSLEESGTCSDTF